MRPWALPYSRRDRFPTIHCRARALLEGTIGLRYEKKTMSWIRIVIAGCLTFSMSLPMSSEISGEAVTGKWLTAPADGGQSHIEIMAHGEIFKGKIVWLELPTYPADDELGMGGQKRVDRKNPDSSKHRDPILGLEILDGLRYEGDGKWAKGTIYDPNNGKTYKSQLRLTESGTLAVRGYIGFSLLGRTTEWTRVLEPETVKE